MSWDYKGEHLAILHGKGELSIYRNTIFDTFTPNSDRMSFSLKYNIFILEKPHFGRNFIIEKAFMNFSEHFLGIVLLLNSGEGFQSYFSVVEKDQNHFLLPKTFGFSV